MSLVNNNIRRIFGLAICLLMFCVSEVSAHSWEEHRQEIADLERSIFKHQQELDVLVDKKKNTRDRARIEETLQRIVEIHAELISLRKSMDNTRNHLEAEHPEKAHILDDYDSRMAAMRKHKRKYLKTPLSDQLDELLLKVQMKYATFIRTDDKTDEMIAVEAVLSKKKKKKKEREADVYLRKRSRIRLTK